ncbi:response regulator transcription factor [Streptomyces sp. H10-C2]|uniref:helix-turn-helix transcriptional regulator n=1 Tax=unclassified Streptomyces TaxID=2593676 RepID=UPI0024B8ED8A|nr:MULTISPECIES: response regulator transcription factor [unclassified Streptomyces]MDJ0341470.1 response regulator transcription factor [Streptomyces sp. PH10-H1]MDJ0369127.1 response regulator transcription factor [Streptomyces sp. H10-C2]
MESSVWTDPEHALSVALEVLRSPLGQTLPSLSGVLADLIPHRASAKLTGYCAHYPMKTAGAPELVERITSAELSRLAGIVPVGRPWQGEAVVAGATRPVFAAASAEVGANGALLVLIDTPTEPLPEAAVRVVQRLWDLVSVHLDYRAAESAPGMAAQSRATASERARVIAELGEAQAATLSGLLGTLRSRSLDDATARRTATDLAVSAMIELRAAADREQILSEEPADAAFARIAAELDPLVRYGPVQLDLRSPDSERTLPIDAAHAARAATRAVVLAMLEQDDLRRIHVGWQIEDDVLRVTVRDDGPGSLAPEALTVHRVTDRLKALGGRLVLDAVPGWGTTVTGSVPLGPVTATSAAHPLAALGGRELEVLEHLAQGHRNRAIAEDLHISESTVKFHVANILSKLGVGTRGEAAALARSAGDSAAA